MDEQRALEGIQRRNDKEEIAVGHTTLENLLGEVELCAGAGHPGEPVPIRQDPGQTGNRRERGGQNAVAEGGLLGFAWGKRERKPIGKKSNKLRTSVSDSRNRNLFPDENTRKTLILQGKSDARALRYMKCTNFY
jgi:hypothetical protein